MLHTFPAPQINVNRVLSDSNRIENKNRCPTTIQVDRGLLLIPCVTLVYIKSAAPGKPIAILYQQVPFVLITYATTPEGNRA